MLMQKQTIIFILMLCIGVEGFAADSVKKSENISFISAFKKRWNRAVKRYNAAVDKDAAAMVKSEEQIDEPFVDSHVQEDREEHVALSDAEKLNFVFKSLYKKKKKAKRSWFGCKPSYVSHAAWATFALGLTYVLKKSYDALSTKEGQKSFTEHVTAAAVDGAIKGLGNQVGDAVVDGAQQELPKALKNVVGAASYVASRFNGVVDAYHGVERPEQPEPVVAAAGLEEPPKSSVVEGLSRVAEHVGGEGARRNVEIALEVACVLVAPKKQEDAEAEEAIPVVPEKDPKEIAQELVDKGKEHLAELQKAAGNVGVLIDDFNSVMDYYHKGKRDVGEVLKKTKETVGQLGEEIVANQPSSQSWVPWLGVKAFGSYVAIVNKVSKRLGRGSDVVLTDAEREAVMKQYNDRIAAKALKEKDKEEE
jgi:hypothetical protein